ncbi:MAG: DUF452 family protein [Odoribacteraceae bacterium]|jgi:biotin synthesis protein BioG|nr:DUF452 family protein [Odoribacteraceae bacterium]
MRAVWLIKDGGRRLTLFFGGWGLDERSVGHLTSSGKVLMYHDYRDVETGDAPDVTGYDVVDVVAWSMGVWAASVSLARWGITPRRAVALNGTERPVDDLLGIPPAIYALTERGMNERGWEKFITRSLADDEERALFRARCLPRRGLEERVEELRRVREQSARACPVMPWHRAFISCKDVIFPVENQRNWWQGRTEITGLAGGHYPFFRFTSWESIIEYGNR